jgi:hypothetical protein
MFERIGAKIKLLAKIYCYVGMGISILIGLGFIYLGATNNIAGSVLIGFLCLMAGPVVAWVSSWLLYGFGTLIDNSDLLVDSVYNNFDDTYDNNYDENYDMNN